MKKVIYLMALCCISFGCTLEEPCEDDELYSTDGKCIKCIAQAMPGYHLEDGHCVKDSDKSCGDLKKDCQNLADKGVELAECREGECIPTSCKKDLGYKLVNNTCVFSIPDSSFECGMEPNVHNCMQKGVKTADCVKLEGAPEDSLLRICRVSDCWPGYHRVENIDDNNDWMPFTCEEDTSEKCGEGKVNCLDGEGIADAICLNGGCQILSCKADEGYKLKDNGCRISISDFPYECGLAPNVHNCMHDGVTDNGVGCVRDPNDLDDSLKRICSVSECLTGYHLVVNEDSDKDWLPKKCELDTSEKCGSGVNGPINCLDGDGIVDAVCGGGRCLIQSCDEKEGYKLKDNKCELAVFELPEKCGLQTDTAEPHNCIQDGVQTAVCTNDPVELTNLKKRICLVTECKPRFHQVDNIGEDSDWMPSVCELDTEEKCGGSSENNNCHKLFGADIVSCELGQCVIKTCDAKSGYEKDDQGRCILPETRACGQSKTDCVKDWLEDVYHNTEQQNASTPVCDKGQCSLNYCAPTYIKVSCSEYNKYYANGKTIAGCRDKITDSVCIKDPCPRVVNKTGDDDYDGVINCFDVCPFNPTKSDQALWLDEAGSNGVRCDILDTDLDGIDDSEDVCPTRADIQTIEDLRTLELCKGNGCPSSMSVFLNYSDDRKATFCGIYTAASSTEPAEIHIYHGKDLEFARKKLLEIHRSLACTSAESCNGMTKYNVCENGILNTYSCSSCMNKVCEGKTIIPLVTKVKVFLEKDINLYDYVVTAFKQPELNEESKCYSVLFSPVDNLTAAEFDGQDNAISYVYRPNTESEQRCYLLNALFSEVSISSIKRTTFDFDVIGTARSIVMNHADAVSVEDVKVSGTVTSFNGDNDGAGALAGRIENKLQIHKQNQLQNVELNNVSVDAANTNYVGGVVGDGNSVLVSNVSVNSINIYGHDTVGGLFGNGNNITMQDVDVVNQSIVGHDYIGGLMGNARNVSAKNVNVDNATIEAYNYVGGVIGSGELLDGYDVTNHTDLIKGRGDYIGGAFGKTTANYTGTFYNILGTVSGGSYVGGFAGDVYFNSNAADHIWLYNDIDSVDGAENVGGVFGRSVLGHGDYLVSGIYNRINVIKPSDSVAEYMKIHIGGIIGSVFTYTNLRFSDIYNQVGDISARNGSAGGVFGTFVRGGNGYLKFSNVYNSLGEISVDTGTAGGIGGAFDSDYSCSSSDAFSIFVDDVHSEIRNFTAASGHDGTFPSGGFLGQIRSKVLMEISNLSVLFNGTNLNPFIGGDYETGCSVSVDSSHDFSFFWATHLTEDHIRYVCDTSLDNVNAYYYSNFQDCRYNENGVISSDDFASIRNALIINCKLNCGCPYCTEDSDPEGYRCASLCEQKWSYSNFMFGDSSLGLPSIKNYLLNVLIDMTTDCAIGNDGDLACSFE